MSTDRTDQHWPDVLDIARATGLRQHLHGINATDARALLTSFVDALDDARARIVPYAQCDRTHAGSRCGDPDCHIRAIATRAAAAIGKGEAVAVKDSVKNMPGFIPEHNPERTE